MGDNHSRGRFVSGRAAAAVVLVLGAFSPLSGCGDDDGGGLEAVGQPCDAPGDCYPGVDTDLLAGEVTCMSEVPDGYCTHHCADDGDCCAAPGECDTDNDLDYVCGPFESTGEKFCFISCEGVDDGDGYCQTWAHPDFICRSTGGGSENRKVCVPNG